MEFQIITFGNGEILAGVFNAIAVCLNAGSGTLYTPLIRISMIVGGLWAIIYAIYGDYIKSITNWIIPMTIIVQLLFVPQTSIHIVDPIFNYHAKVDHVPYGLALISGKISEFGFYLTQQVEKVFALPDDLKYQQNGMLFAGKLLQQARTFKITNEDLNENMRNFVGQCVAYDVLLGRKYTLDELRNSDDIWALVSTNASRIRSFLWRNIQRSDIGSRSEIITCKEGAIKFHEQWPEILKNTSSILNKKLFSNFVKFNIKAEVLQYFPIAYSFLTGISKSAEQILQQNIMIYSIVDGLEYKSTQAGNAPNFAARRAYLQQRLTYDTLGEMAAETLPVIKAVIEAILYSAFLFVIPLSILPFGYTFLKTWIQVLLWLQMWAPMYAVLNYVMTMAASYKSIAALSISNKEGVTIASSIGLANVNADISAMTGYLAMSVPFLCIAIVKGISSFVNVPAILSGVSTSNASQMANEAASGNYNIGNVTHGTRQAHNTNMLSTNYAASYTSGSFKQADGHVEMLTTADGEQIVNVSRSNLPVSLNIAESQSSQLMTQAGHSYQKGMQQSEAYVKNISNSLRQIVDLSDHINQTRQSGTGFTENESVDQINSLNKTSQMVKDFAKENRLSMDQTSQLIMSAGIGGSKGLSILKALGFSIQANQSLYGQASLQKMYHKAERLVQSEEFQSSIRINMQNARQKFFNAHDETARRLSEGITKAWDEADSLRIEASKNFNTSEHYQNQAQQATASAVTINSEHLQQALQWYANSTMDNTNGTIGMKEAARVFAMEPNLRNKILQSYVEQKGLFPKNNNALSSLSPDHLYSNFQQENKHAFMTVTNTVDQNTPALLKHEHNSIITEQSHNLKKAFNSAHNNLANTIFKDEKDIKQRYSEIEKQNTEQFNKNLITLSAKQSAQNIKNLLEFGISAVYYSNKQIDLLDLEDKS